MKPSTSPLPIEVCHARVDAGLTQREAAALLHTTDRVWRQWEAGDRAMHAAFWELFRLKLAPARRRRARQDEPCAECERSNGPHYRGRCDHGRTR